MHNSKLELQYSSNFCHSEKFLSKEHQMLSVVYDQFEFQSLCVFLYIFRILSQPETQKPKHFC